MMTQPVMISVRTRNSSVRSTSRVSSRSKSSDNDGFLPRLPARKADHSTPRFRGILPQSSVRRKRVTAMVMATSIRATSASASKRMFSIVAPFSMMARTMRR